MEAGLGRGGIAPGLGRGMPPGVGRPPPWTPNGLLPGPRAGGRPPGRGAAPGLGAPPAGAGAAAGPGRGPGPAPGVGAPPAGGSRRTVSRCRAACAALTAASWSALSAAARTSAAATSMSWALAGLTTGACGRGGPGTGPRRSPVGFSAAGRSPTTGRLGGIGRAAGLPPGLRTGLPTVAGWAGAAAEDAAGAAADDGADGAADVSMAARSRRATGASTVLDADFTYSPSSCSFASTALLSTPSSFASSCTRALPATALLTPRLGRQSRANLTRPLEAWSLRRLHRVLMPVVLPCESGRELGAPTIGKPGPASRAQTASASAPVSITPAIRSARPKARRRSAKARQAGSKCRCAPRPGRLRAGSGTTLKRSAP